MKAIATVIQGAIAILLAICVVLLIQIRNRTFANGQFLLDPQAGPAQSTDWKYAEFEFDGPRIKDSDGAALRAVLLNYDSTLKPIETNQVFGAGELLTAISDDGWQYVWTDGKRYLVRRRAGDWKRASFLLNYEPEPK